jgi:hypothetical protein
MTVEPARPDAISIGDKVAFLAALPGVVQVIETHMAFVFLTGDFAFKLKKPVSFGYFDHRSLGARHGLRRGGAAEPGTCGGCLHRDGSAGAGGPAPWD